MLNVSKEDNPGKQWDVYAFFLHRLLSLWVLLAWNLLPVIDSNSHALEHAWQAKKEVCQWLKFFATTARLSSWNNKLNVQFQNKEPFFSKILSRMKTEKKISHGTVIVLGGKIPHNTLRRFLTRRTGISRRYKWGFVVLRVYLYKARGIESLENKRMLRK